MPRPLAKTSATFAGFHTTPHTFRHTTALHLVQAGVDIVSVKEILGHADIKTTSLYVQIDLNMKRKALDQCPAPTPNHATALPSGSNPAFWNGSRHSPSHVQRIM